MDFYAQVISAIDICRQVENKENYRAKLIKTKDIIVDERVRLKCTVSGCPQFEKRHMCPPNLPSVEEFRAVLARYTFGILIQLTGVIKSDDWLTESDAYALMLHQTVYDVEKMAFRKGFSLAAGFIGGACKLCGECKDSCANPEKARPAMEGMGIDVVNTVEAAGMPIEFKKGRVTWTGLVVLD
jgi:predicted metal-binding protein